MSIVTDSEAGIPENVFAIHKLFKPEKELKDFYASNSGKYKSIKEALIEDIDAFIKPLREKRKQVAENQDMILDILESGKNRAGEVASKKLNEVKEKIGVI